MATRKAANRKLDRNRNGNGNLHKELHGQRWDDWDLVHKHLWCHRSDLVHKLKNTITQWWTSSFTYWEVGPVTQQLTLSGISIRNGYTCPLVGSDQYWNLINGKPVVGPVGLSLLTWDWVGCYLDWLRLPPKSNSHPLLSLTHLELTFCHWMWRLQTDGLRAAIIWCPRLRSFCVQQIPGDSSKVAVAADFERAFLMIAMTQKNRDVLRFLWIDDVSKPNNETIVLRLHMLCLGCHQAPFF